MGNKPNNLNTMLALDISGFSK